MNATLVSRAAQAAQTAPSAAETQGGSAFRRRLGAAAVAADVGAVVAGYVIGGLLVHSGPGEGGVGFLALLAAMVLITLACSAGLGLYSVEAFVSRPLHLFTVGKAVGLAAVVTSCCAFVATALSHHTSPVWVLSAFLAVFLIAAALRLLLLDAVYRAHVRRTTGGTLVVCRREECDALLTRVADLRGYGPVRVVEPLDRSRNGHDAEPALVDAVSGGQRGPAFVIIDGQTVGRKAALDLVDAAAARGADVYVAGRLLSPLDGSRILLHLFGAPLARVRRRGGRGITLRKRTFDVVAAATALVILAPGFAVIALLIRRDSPGPVFFRQQRVGVGGRTFEFVKFRSMTMDNDPCVHRDYVTRFIEGGEDALGDTPVCGAGREPVFKLSDDDRVTRVGRWLRKYSLDELPQFWNVLRGDMSLVGPRPALEYEVEAYKPWHLRRLATVPGISGLWQVAGRSQVDFDQMVFQDILYDCNQGVLTDVGICLRTVPAVVVARGAV